jgi:hypothetical protein
MLFDQQQCRLILFAVWVDAVGVDQLCAEFPQRTEEAPSFQANPVSIASVSSTSGTAAGNLHDFGFDVPSVASCERLSAPSQDHMHRAFFKCTSFPSRLTTSPKKTPAEYVRTMQTLPIKSIRPPVETHKSTQ